MSMVCWKCIQCTNGLGEHQLLKMRLFTTGAILKFCTTTQLKPGLETYQFARKKDLKLTAHERFPVYDYGKLHPEKTRLYVFGSTEQGATGLARLLKPKNGNRVIKFIQRPVRQEFGDLRFVKDIAAGHGFTLLSVKPHNTDDSVPLLFGCGLNTHSQLGFQAVRPTAPLEVLLSIVPIYLPFPKQPRIIALGAGRAHSVISLENGGIVTFGDNSAGQCGRYIINDEQYFGSKLFHKIDRFGSTKDDDIIDITCRFDVTFCLSRNGKLFSFGENSYGQLGRGAKVNKAWAPSQVTSGGLASERIIKVSTSGSSVLAVTEKGDLFAWGDNVTGHINPGERNRVLFEPTFVKLHQKIGKVKDVAVSDGFSFILNEKGDVYSWGIGESLGLGPTNKVVKTPTIIPPPLFGRNDFCPEAKIKSICTGFFYSAAVTSNGDMYTWGKNESGCLGLGDAFLQTFPLKVCLNGSVQKVAIGVDHTLALCTGSI